MSPRVLDPHPKGMQLGGLDSNAVMEEEITRGNGYKGRGNVGSPI